MLLLIALAGAILCTIASSADLGGPAEEVYNATVEQNGAVEHNDTVEQNGTVEQNDAVVQNGTVVEHNGTADEAFNGTVYRLDELVEVTVPINASQWNITLPEKVDNITLYDETGKIVAINSSYRFKQGKSIYSLDFGRHVKGKLVYNLTSQGQRFVISLQEKGPVRVILPEGYTTGERFMGIAWPSPYVIASEKGATTITWNNTTRISYIEVNYYRKNAPVALMIIISILALAAIALLIEYYSSIRKLRASRMQEEEKAMKKS